MAKRAVAVIMQASVEVSCVVSMCKLVAWRRRGSAEVVPVCRGGRMWRHDQRW